MRKIFLNQINSESAKVLKPKSPSLERAEGFDRQTAETQRLQSFPSDKEQIRNES